MQISSYSLSDFSRVVSSGKPTQVLRHAFRLLGDWRSHGWRYLTKLVLGVLPMTIGQHRANASNTVQSCFRRPFINLVPA